MTAMTAQRMARRTLMAALSAAVLFGASATASAQTPAPAPAQQADQYVFTYDSLIMGFQITETGTAEFESFFAKVKEAMQKSAKPDRKQQAESMKLLKLETPPQGGVVQYFLLIEKVVKGASYDLFKVLSEEMPPADVQEIYKKVSPVFKGGISFTQIKIAG